MQTQIFHTAFHTNYNMLLGAPTGSGKTIAAELTLFRMFNEAPGEKAVYIAPLKALSKERLIDWEERLGRQLGKVTENDSSPLLGEKSSGGEFWPIGKYRYFTALTRF